jgi:hypothetical protein
LAKSRQEKKLKLKFQKKRIDFGGFQSPKVMEKK